MASTSAIGGQDRGTLADQAYQEICDRLVTLRIRPGEPVHDGRLAEELELGRTPVREALKRLEIERLVIAYPRRGTFATEVQIADLSHISEVRQELEPLAASLAATRATAADRSLLADYVACLEAAPPGHGTDAETELLRLDMAVHRAVYAVTHNPYLEATLTGYDNLATRIWCLFLDRLTDLDQHVHEHGRLLRAIIEGDAAKASAVAAEHVANFERAIRAII
ncbi:GntR family transcriptional regulator [Streptomyces beihaiensis]|uniref:GntR family transcriptional regulator n=1 Tax=Streptomyces beihaiensis TaxID=2984495 RepID=A0ABT3U4C0_9ACTN|nr:GntR family transcriptional regulator [Streptomyces beihaiensis]MCX3064161.1 GntR family transcriptional regulator [Streptomyces beihaiensis]